jgi:hypothetical protein
MPAISVVAIKLDTTPSYLRVNGVLTKEYGYSASRVIVPYKMMRAALKRVDKLVAEGYSVLLEVH